MTDGLQFYINSAWVNASTYGVMMGDGFLDALLAPVPVKPYISNKSRLMDGKRIIIPAGSMRKDERSLTLNFTISGTSTSDFRTKRTNFYNLLYGGLVIMGFAGNDAPTTDKFRLYYEPGNSVTYGGDLSHSFCKIAVRFIEADPTDRTNPAQ